MDTTLTKLSAIFESDLARLAVEVNKYPSEESLWLVGSGITNRGGNLVLHICGNLQHFIGSVLGKTDYIRDRPNEFAARGVIRSELQNQIASTIQAVIGSLKKLNKNDLESQYPADVAFGPENMTILEALVILAAHLNYHLGQINYHRRLLT